METATAIEIESENLSKIAALAPVVAASAAELEGAIDAETTAGAAVLERAIGIARPALRAICSRLRSEHYTSGGRNGLHPTEREEWHAGGYFCLTDDAGFVPGERSSTGNEGEYTGRDYAVNRDGAIVSVTYGGSWSRWQGSGTTLTTEIKPRTAAQAVRWYDLGDMLGRLATALQRHADGAAPARAAQARARAAKLAALVTLI